jgi:hypothetical protein
MTEERAAERVIAHIIGEVASWVLGLGRGSIKASLEDLPPVDLLLHAAARDQAVHDNVLRLTDAVRPAIAEAAPGLTLSVRLRNSGSQS